MKYLFEWGSLIEHFICYLVIVCWVRVLLPSVVSKP